MEISGDHTGSFYVQNGQVAQLTTINQTIATTISVNAGGVAYLPTTLKLLSMLLHIFFWY